MVTVRFSQVRIAAEVSEVWPRHAVGSVDSYRLGNAGMHACKCKCGTSYVVTQPKPVVRQFCALRSIEKKLLSSREMNRGAAVS